MRSEGWWRRMSFGTVDCNVCGRPIHEGQLWYMPKDGQLEQGTALDAQRGAGVGILLRVCECCVAFTEVTMLLESREHNRPAIGRSTLGCDWRKDGY